MKRALLLLVPVCTIASCSDPKKPIVGPQGKRDGGGEAGIVTLPPAPPLPTVPAGLPDPPKRDYTPEAVALGELLFWDTRLSTSGTLACASCHDPLHGYAGAQRQETTAGKANLRRAPALVNLAWRDTLGWDGRFASFDAMIGAHAQGQLGSDLATTIARIGEVPGYHAHFARVGGEPSAALAGTALEAYVMTRYEGASPWDRVERSPDVPAELRAGFALFENRAQCGVCHVPPLYTDRRYHRLGVIATPDEGRGKVDKAQQGAFATPSLRGAARREGFFHDGSASSLELAIDWHLAGGIGQGADPSIVDVKKVSLTAKEREQLVAFVRALTDPSAPMPHKPALP